MATTAPEVLTIDEAAEYLRVHPTTIVRMIERGELRGSKVGTRWRVRRSSLDALVP